MGHIPGFTLAIFPAAAMPNLTLVANLGLVLFLFLVGLEVDLRYLASNWRIALSVGLTGMAVPFGLGCAIAWGLYNHFSGEPGTVSVSFGVYMLFIGVAMAITVSTSDFFNLYLVTFVYLIVPENRHIVEGFTNNLVLMLYYSDQRRPFLYYAES
jgi:Sodium/hydrogen exchanger family